VAADQPIVLVETDKVNAEVQAPCAGLLGAQRYAEGDVVEVGAVLCSVVVDDQPA
jgi:pyruvate/2-oxoglutarate dehydrogenase complex dihydrolipoamide acyltransferase (E2) component